MKGPPVGGADAAIMKTFISKAFTVLAASAILLTGCATVKDPAASTSSASSARVLPDDAVITAKLQHDQVIEEPPPSVEYSVTKEGVTKIINDWGAGSEEKILLPVSQQDWINLKEAYAELPASALGEGPAAPGCPGAGPRYIKVESSGTVLAYKGVDCDTTKEGEAEYQALQNWLILLIQKAEEGLEEAKFAK